MNRIDRYKILIRHMKDKGLIESQKDLGVKLGYNNPSAFSQVINGKVKEPKQFIPNLKRLIPYLNTEWLETGAGSMSLSDEQTDVTHNDDITQINDISINRETFELISKLIDTVHSQQRTIESLREENKKFPVHAEDDAACAHASGSDISETNIKKLFTK